MSRAIKIINETIKNLNVSIKEKIVLTEVGSDNYLFTPIIASLCGAAKVYALAKDSKYGKADEIINKCKVICKQFELNNIIFLQNELDITVLQEADIITNSGNLRPLDKDKLKFLKPSAVIPLMFEAWEIREEDIDLAYCKNNKIRVAGTWENHPSIRVFDYCGLLGMKMSMDAGFEIAGNRIVMWSDDEFGEVISKKFTTENAEVIHTTDLNFFYEVIKEIDFVFIANYDEQRNYFGDGGIFDWDKIKKINPDVYFIHLYGNLDYKYCCENQINISPKKNGRAMVMTHTLSYIGLIPILKLQVAGFKVAQELIHNNITSITQVL